MILRGQLRGKVGRRRILSPDASALRQRRAFASLVIETRLGEGIGADLSFVEGPIGPRRGGRRRVPRGDGLQAGIQPWGPALRGVAFESGRRGRSADSEPPGRSRSEDCAQFFLDIEWGS